MARNRLLLDMTRRFTPAPLCLISCIQLEDGRPMRFIILLALTTVAIPALTETAAAAHIFDAWGSAGSE